MSLAREVAEAYIEVHGDMAPFRHDLEKAAADIRKLAQEEGESFGSHFTESLKAKTTGQWQAILDANFRDGKIDWDRAIGKFDSSNLDEARDKMHQFVLEMQELGKLEGPDGNMFEDLVDSIDNAIDARQRYDDAVKASADAREQEKQGIADTIRYNKMWRDQLVADIQAARIENDAWMARRRKTMEEAMADNAAFDRSFNGMVKNIQRTNLEETFVKVAAAWNNMDFSKVAKGTSSFEELRDKVASVTAAMEEQGRINRGNAFEISAELEDWIAKQDTVTESVKKSTNETSKLSGVWKAMGPVLDRNVAKLRGFMGLNVLGDMVKEGGEFFSNIDRHAVSIGKMTVLFGGMATAAISALGGIATVSADLVTTAGGLAAVLPAFFIGAAIQVGVLQAAFKDMGTVLADLAPAFHALQDTISAKFWAQAEEPIRSMVNTLMPTLNTQLGNTATALGGMFGKLATAIKDIPLPSINLMFDRMNAGINNASGAMSPLVQAFTTLGVVGSEYFERFGTWITKLSTDFNAFIQAAAADGRLNGWIDAMIEGFKNLGKIVAGAWGIMSALNDAAVKAGGTGLAGLADNIGKVSDALNSLEGQKVLETLFFAANSAVRAVKESIIGIGPALMTALPTIEKVIMTVGNIMAQVVTFIGTIISNPAFLNGANNFMEGVRAGVGALTPAMPVIAESLGQVLDLLGLVAPLVGSLVTAFLVNFGPALDQVAAAFGRIAQVAGPELTGIINALGPVFQTVMGILLPPLEKLVTAVLPLANQLFAALAPLFPVIATAMAPVIDAVTQLINMIGPSLVPAFHSIVAAVSPVIAVFGQVVGFVLSVLVPILGVLIIGVIQNVVGVFQGLSTFIMGFVQIVTAIFTGFGAFFTKLFAGDIGGALGALGEMFANIWNGIVAMLTGALQFLWNAVQLLFIGKLIMGIRTALMNIGTFFKSTWDNIVAFLKGALDNINGTVAQGFTAVWNFISTIWTAVRTFFQTMWTSITQVFSTALNAVGTAVSTVFNTVRTFIATVWNAISAFLGTVWNNILTFARAWISNFQTGVTTGFNAIRTFLTTVWNTIMNTIRTVVTNILTTVRTWISNASSAISTGFNAVRTFLTTVWNTIMNTIRTVIANILRTVVQWILNARTAITAGFNAIRTFLSTVWNNIMTTIRTVVNNILTAVRTWINNARTAITSGFNTVRSFISTVWNNIMSTIRSVVGNILSTVVGWISNIVSRVSAGFNAVMNTARSIWNSIWSTISGVANSIWATVSGFVARVASTIYSGFMNAVNYVRSAWSSMVGAVASGVGQVMSWVGSIPGRISGALGWVGNILVNAGRSIINGLLNGLKAAWGAVTSFVGGIADWIARNKGPIPYDRKLLVPAGQAIMYGLENSLKDKFGNVMDFVGSMADMMAGNFDKSKMYLAGADASQGLADGLLANKSKIKGVYSDLGNLDVPDANLGSIKARTDGRTSVGGSSAPSLTLAEGAVQVHTQATSPKLVAGAVTDGLDEVFSMFSTM